MIVDFSKIKELGTPFKNLGYILIIIIILIKFLIIFPGILVN